MIRGRGVYWGLFSVHLGLIIFALTAGLWLPLWLTLGLVAAHRLHLRLLGGCALSKLQERLGHLERGQSFISHAAEKLFTFRLSPIQAVRLDQIFLSLSTGLAVVTHLR